MWTRHGRVLGIEMLRPARPWPIDEIAARFKIDGETTWLLRELYLDTPSAPGRHPFPGPALMNTG
jgi:hypothetical protein